MGTKDIKFYRWLVFCCALLHSCLHGGWEGGMVGWLIIKLHGWGYNVNYMQMGSGGLIKFEVRPPPMFNSGIALS